MKTFIIIITINCLLNLTHIKTKEQTKAKYEAMKMEDIIKERVVYYALAFFVNLAFAVYGLILLLG